MRSFTATDEQTAIIETDEPRFMVRAAAGSGKTFVIVRRYLRHILDEGCDPRSVLAFTFTAKAAAEMRKRVVDELRDRGEPELAQAVETGPISTIHSFCERLLRENAIEAGLDPEFEIATEADSAEMQRAAVRQVLTSADSEVSPEAVELVGELTGRIEYGSSGPYDFLESAVLQVLGAFRSAGLNPSDLDVPEGNSGVLIRRWHAHICKTLPPALADALRPHLGLPSFYAHAIELCRTSVAAGGFPRPPWLKDGVPTAEPLGARHAAALGELASAAWQHLEERMFEARHLDFAALERRAVRLLGQSEPTLRRLNATYRHVLVDEAQDLNPMQHRLIEKIDPQSLMLVGDGQQSIYGFRQADLATFERKADELRGWDLSRNHRSADAVLRFVDTVATSLWSSAYKPMLPPPQFDLDEPNKPAEADFDGVELWLSGRATAERNAARWVRSLVGDEGEAPGSIGVLVRNWKCGATMVRELLREGVPARLSGGLTRFYTRLEIRDLANALRVLSDPSDNFSMLAVLHSPLAGLSLDAVALLAGFERVFEALPAFLPPSAHDQAKLAAFLSWYCPLAANSGRLSAWETLSELFATSGYLEALASRPRHAETLANVRKLLLLAAERLDLGSAEFAEWIGDVESLKHREAEASTVDDHADAVTVLTMHSAKGLEFDIVVLPETHTRNVAKRRHIEIDPNLVAFSAHFDGEPSPFHVFLSHLRQTREREEAARLLYVALTRAKRRLAVVTHAQAGNDTFAGIIARAVGLNARTTPFGYRIRNEAAQDTSGGEGNLD
ncbi:MAG: UvrD-helicase domain-containing protein [Fimbriimonadaceae bacterium]